MSNTLSTRPTWLSFDLTQFDSNLKVIKQLSDGKILWPAVKADAYHHGIKHLLPTFLKNDITHFCVAYLDEAIVLQEYADALNAKIEILIFGDVPSYALNKVQENWSLTVAHEAFLHDLLSYGEKKQFNIQIKIDSGMNRRGFKDAGTYENVVERIEGKENLHLTGLYTHFATADNDPNENYKIQQLQTFHQIVGDSYKKYQYIHSQNSHGLLTVEDEFNIFNSVRPGAICYGLSVKTEGVEPIASLYSKIFEVKKIAKGEKVGYNISFEAPIDGYIAILPIGYADGLWRSNTGNKVVINNHFYPIVGKVCMEQCMLFSETPDDFVIDNIVEIFGSRQSISTYAVYNETIDYEVMCSMAERIIRKYDEVGR